MPTMPTMQIPGQLAPWGVNTLPESCMVGMVGMVPGICMVGMVSMVGMVPGICMVGMVGMVGRHVVVESD